MIITPITIIPTGPGVEIEQESDGLTVRMSGPVEDFECAANEGRGKLEG